MSHRCILVLISLLLIDTQLLAEPIDFNRQIRPILSDACFQCHGPDEAVREADLRLDKREGLFGDLGGYSAVVPGDLKASELIARITSEDGDLRMPPSDSGKSLTAVQIELLKTWVREGASWNEHWAFVPPSRPSLPEVKDQDWPTNDLDRFILARLEQEGLAPSPRAKRSTLVRRLYLDLVGLPPSSADVHEFSEQTDEGAYERLVDKLLESPHYGERIAMPWLDQARYADTNGYSIDGGREMWLWRDWVINAYNENMPFDQFVTEQLAGDLVPDASESQRTASGFSRNHMITHEGGTIPEENLVNYAADRVRTTSEVFLGLTMGCAQCHDHKYDPLTQRDYYRFFAYFNTLSDEGLDGRAGVNAGPKIATRTVRQTKAEVEAIDRKLENLRSELLQPHPDQPRWEEATRRDLAQRGKRLQLFPLRVLKVTEPNQGGSFEIQEGHTVFVQTPRGHAPSVSLQLDQSVSEIQGLRIEFLPDPSFPGGSSGHGQKHFPGGFILTGFSTSATLLPADQVDLYRLLKVSRATASRSDPTYPPEDCLDERDHNGWSPGSDFDKPQHITFTFSEPVNPSLTPFMTAMMIWGGAGIDDPTLMAGRYRFYAFTGQDDGTNVPEDVQHMLTIEPAQRSSEQATRVRDFFASVAPELADVRYAIANLEDRRNQLTAEHETMVMNTAAEPRVTYMLNRGQYDQPTEAVEPGVPSALPPLAEGAPANRLGLAQWLVEKNHPLTARVAVNRIWQMLFGRGLVATSENFGLQGEPPSHPQLLDWLAIEFVENGWDTKALIKTIVMSSTYRQQSTTTQELLERDPLNQFLARGPRRRLEAELVRDLALKMSGLLVPRIGGESVYPYQPPVLWKEVSHFGSAHSSAQVFVQDHGEKLYRRSMYTYWKRTSPPPSMTAFDAPNRELCVMRRQVTNTPLQALVLLNDPQFVEAARAFGERIMLESPDDSLEGRIRFAFEEATSRLPDSDELSILRQSYERHFQRWRNDPSAAHEFLSVGERPSNDQLDSAEHAAWTSIASLILNMSEVISTK